MSRSKQKGTAAETAVVNALRRLGWPHVERRALTGALDKGDIAGMPGVCWEVKDAKVWHASGWLKETLEERANANATHGILAIKLPGVGHANAEKWLTVMDDAHAFSLWNEASVTSSSPSSVLPYIQTIKAMGLVAGVTELKVMEKSVTETGSPPLLMVRVKRRLAVPGDHAAYYNLMRLDARCRLLTYAGYGGREIIGETM